MTDAYFQDQVKACNESVSKLLGHVDQDSFYQYSVGNFIYHPDRQRIGQLVPKALIDRMTQAVHDFVGDAEQSDDLTMLVVQYHKHD